MSAHLLLLAFVYISKFIKTDVLATISVIDKGIFPLEKDSVAIQFYLDIENRHPSRVCRVVVFPNKCCLNNPKDSDCTLMKVYGHYKGLVREKDRETLIFVLPSIYQHDLYGSCDFNIMHQCDRNKKQKKGTVEIHLDTRLRRHTANDLLLSYIGDRKTESCDNVDENSLENCDAANCDQKYLGAKSYFDNDMRRCIEVTSCVSDVTKELPNSVYLPFTNLCRDYDHPITLADIYAISTRMGVVTEQPKYKNEETIELKSNCSTVSQNLLLLRDMLNGKLCKLTGGSDYGQCCKNAILAILKCIGFLLILMFGFIFMLTLTSWLWMKWSSGEFNAFLKKCKLKTSKQKERKKSEESVKHITYSTTNTKVKNDLLKQVMVRDIPMELRDGVVNICNRINDDVGKKKRYRRSALGSQISLNKGDDNNMTDSSSDETEDEDRKPLVK